MKVLVVGDQRSKMRFQGWENVEFIDDPDPTKNGPFDYIVLDNLLNQAERAQVLPIVNMYAANLADKGQLSIIVPSLEWACKEIAKNDEPNPMAYLSIYGTEQEPCRCGMTILWLRLVIEQTGLMIIKANTELYSVLVNEQQFQAQQNVVTGLRLSLDPANAFTETMSQVPEFA